MKNSILPLCIVLLLSAPLYAQFNGSASISFGPSIAVSDFGSTDSSNEHATGAGLGIISELSLNYLLRSNIGIAAAYRYVSNSQHTDQLRDMFVSQTGIPATMSATNWKSFTTLLGIYSSYPIGTTYSINGKLMLGYMQANSPELILSIINGSMTETIKQEVGTTYTLSFLVAMGMQMKLSRKFLLLLNADYMEANPTFENVRISGNGRVLTTSFMQRMSMLNISLGIGLGIE